ncbi:MAG: 4-alpha-glucanotransferase [Alphaproteobacteria bacterium]
MNNIKMITEFFGLSSSYTDKMGKHHNTTDEIRREFLKSLNYPADKLDIKNFAWKNGISPTISFFKSDDKLIDIYIPTSYLKSEIKYTFSNKSKNFQTKKITKYRTVETKIIDKINYSHINFKVDLPSTFDYYTLKVNIGNFSLESFIIYAPDYCYFPEYVERKKQKLLGIGVQLYALRSKSDMGVGNFSTLQKLIKQVSKMGCDFVGLNPLGAMYKDSTSDVSPYRTLSRQYLNYLYIDLIVEEDFKKSPSVQKYISTNNFKKQIEILKSSDIVDYKATLNLKLSILKKMYQYFCGKKTASLRWKKFLKFKDDEELINLCLFETLLETEGDFWQNWNTNLKNLNSDNRKKLIKKNQRKIDFYAYCHFIADLQLNTTIKLCKKLKMKIGLYLDLPIGAASNGVEVWQNQNAFAFNMDIGTPPDTIRPKGQTWGLCPLKPFDLQKDYKVFINLLQKTMKSAGALRIDHALGLMRLFWVNQNGKGAYVNYNLKDMIAIVCLESNKHKCVIIGEDLGNVPDGFREYIASHKLLLNKILFRQKDKDGAFLSTKKYPYFSLSQVSTHDQATSCGFWVNSDIEANNDCNLYPKASQYEASLKERQHERFAFVKALEKQDCFYKNKEEFKSCITGDCVPKNLEYSFNMYGAKTQSCFYMIRIEDIVRQTAMQNVPSTVAEYPNWRIKLPLFVENFKTDKNIKNFFKQIRICRK